MPSRRNALGVVVVSVGLLTMGFALAAVVWVGVTELLHSPPDGPRPASATTPGVSYVALLLFGAGITAFGVFGLRWET